MNLAGYQQVLPKDRQTALKINISWHFFFPAASTTPWQLEGVIRAMKNDGYDPKLIHGCHNRTVVIDAHLGERENKQINVIEAHGLQNGHLYEEGEEWINIREAVGDLADKFLCLNKVYPDGFMIPKQFIGANIIHLPTIKTHVFTTTTGAMKNAFGGLLNEKRHWTHPVIHETLVDLLMIQKKIHSGVFAVMDGTFAGDGPGPRCMMPYIKNVILASADQVAIDAVAAKLMGFDPHKDQVHPARARAGAGLRRSARHRDCRRRRGREGELAFRRAVPEDDVRQQDAAQDLLGPAAEAARMVAQDFPCAVGIHRQRALPRHVLVSHAPETWSMAFCTATGAGCSTTGRSSRFRRTLSMCRAGATSAKIPWNSGKRAPVCWLVLSGSSPPASGKRRNSRRAKGALPRARPVRDGGKSFPHFSSRTIMAIWVFLSTAMTMMLTVRLSFL